MKPITFVPKSLVPILLLTGLLALPGAGCSKRDQTDVREKLKDAYAEAKTAVADSWKDVKSYTFEKRNDFSANARNLTAKVDSEIDELRRDYAESKASASRKAAMDELGNLQADYKVKVAALGRATADTWDSAKKNVIASWDRLQAACTKAKQD